MYKKILEWLRYDGALHLLCSVLLLFVFVIDLDVPLITASLLTLVIGVSKEVYDEIWGSGFSWHDIIADLCGIIIGFVIILIGLL